MNLTINGFYLKNVKDFRGHDNTPLQEGELYFENLAEKTEQKIGFLSDSDGGFFPIENFKSQEVKEKYDKTVNKIYTSLNDRRIMANSRMMMKEDLFTLYEIEKELKKNYTVEEIKKLDLMFVLLFRNNSEVDFGEDQLVSDLGISRTGKYYIVPQKQHQDFIENKIKKEELKFTHYKVVSVKELMEGSIEHYSRKNVKYNF